MTSIVGIINSENFNSLGCKDPETFINQKGVKECDVIEFRGDTFASEEIIENLALAKKSLPEGKILLFTLRLKEDGGNWNKSPSEREPLFTKVLLEGLADWMDLELESIHMLPDLHKNLKKSPVKFLLSHHNFQKSYSMAEFQNMVFTMEKYSPDIVKFAVTVRDEGEMVDLIRASQNIREKYPISCLISMGLWGPISRICSPLVGAPITYGFLGGSSVVPGQLAVKKLHKYLKEFESLNNGSPLDLYDKIKAKTNLGVPV